MVFGERYIYTSGDLHKTGLINEETARISRVVIHPKFRGIGLGEHLVRETLSRSGVRVIEALAVMAKYNPFFERAGMLRVNYERHDSAANKKISEFLKQRSFDFTLSKSKAYCCNFFSCLEDEDRKVLLGYLADFVQQPFIKIKTVEADLLTKIFPSEGAYLYWMNTST